MKEQLDMTQEIEPGQEWEIFRFTPEDGPGVVNLFRSVYGDGYPIATYREPQLLIAENKAARTVSSVAKTPKGDIVGHTALFNSAPYPGTFESGAGVVHAAYRGGKGIFTQLVLHNFSIADEMPEVELIFGEPVCNHPFSQKMGVTVRFIPRALEVDLMPAAAYEKEVSAIGRVAAFLSFRTFRGKGQRVYLPSCYRQDFQHFYRDLDDEREFLLAEEPIPPGVLTDLRSQIFAFAGVARVACHAVGSDFSSCLDELEKDLAAKQVVVIQLWLRLDCPWIGAAVALLRERGYFIGGALLRWFDGDGMLMQKIGKRPDWEGICVVDAGGAEIVERVRADWQRTQG